MSDTTHENRLSRIRAEGVRRFEERQVAEACRLDAWNRHLEALESYGNRIKDLIEVLQACASAGISVDAYMPHSTYSFLYAKHDGVSYIEFFSSRISKRRIYIACTTLGSLVVLDEDFCSVSACYDDLLVSFLRCFDAYESLIYAYVDSFEEGENGQK